MNSVETRDGKSIIWSTTARDLLRSQEESICSSNSSSSSSKNDGRYYFVFRLFLCRDFKRERRDQHEHRRQEVEAAAAPSVSKRVSYYGIVNDNTCLVQS